MAPDAGTPPGQTPRRRTLEDIRGGLDAQHPEIREAEGTVEGDLPVPARRGRAWRAYVLAGAIGCIIGQLLILASVAVTRYSDDVTRAPASEPRPSAPLWRADDTAALPAASPPDAVIGALTDAVEPVSPAPSLADDGKAPASTPHAAALQPTSSRPPALRWPLLGPDDWVESQAKLRAALSEWLAMSSRADVETHEADAEVILAADGWTAKTRVPMTAPALRVVREQRWERGPAGWTIVDDREVERRARR